MRRASPSPRLAVWKFASCDGCQLSLLDCEDQILAVADAGDIAYFPEARRANVHGHCDISLVEGSVTTQHDAERIQEIRHRSSFLITIGACATSGGIQALSWGRCRGHCSAFAHVPLVWRLGFPCHRRQDTEGFHRPY